jgi:hypothetical protein
MNIWVDKLVYLVDWDLAGFPETNSFWFESAERNEEKTNNHHLSAETNDGEQKITERSFIFSLKN